MTVQITDYVARALDRLPQQFKEKPHIEKLLTALATPAEELEQALWDLFTMRSVATATGVTLDELGAIVGQPRKGLLDEDYRRLVSARIKVNKSSGKIDELLAIARLVVNDLAVSIETNPEYPAAIMFELTEAGVTDAVAGLVIEFLLAAKGAGVRLLLQHSEDVTSQMFTFGESAFADGAISASATSITGDDFTRFPAAGTAVVDEGLAVEDAITFTSRTDTQLSGVTGVGNAHVDTAAITVTGAAAVGLGFDDFDSPGAGGKFAHIADSIPPETIIASEENLAHLDTITIVASGAGTGELNGPVSTLRFGTGGDGANNAPLDFDLYDYVVDFRWVRNSTGSIYHLRLDPNGVDESSNSRAFNVSHISTGSHVGGGVAGANILSIMALGGAIDDVCTGEVTLRFKSISGQRRHLRCDTTIDRTVDTLYDITHTAYWDDDSTVMTFFDLVCSDAGNNIEAGSYFALYSKLREN